jgi:putative PIN family toxin of toxin-antitoxin system
MTRRIVLDTNVFISALRSSQGASNQLVLMSGGSRFEIALSVPLVVEYEDVAKRLTTETALSLQDVDDIIDYLCSVAHRQEIHFLWRPFLKDPKDDHVLELAVEAGCEAIVTHNVRDFAGSGQFGIEVLTPAQFLDRIGGTS